MREEVWWCPICGAGNGGFGDALPPIDHDCGEVHPPLNGIFNIPESRLDALIHWAKNDKVLAAISVLLILAVWYLAFQAVRWALHPY